MKAKVFLALIAVFASTLITTHSNKAYSAEKLYNYANNYAEFSLAMPEAPSVRTIWAENGNIPYLTTPPQNGAIGEIAFYQTGDSNTKDVFTTEITFLNTGAEFISTLNEQNVTAMIEKDLSYLPELQNKTVKFYPQNNGETKHGEIIGVAVANGGKPIVNAEHFLIGKQSILVIKVSYNIQNEAHDKIYKNMIDTIRYLPL